MAKRRAGRAHQARSISIRLSSEESGQGAVLHKGLHQRDVPGFEAKAKERLNVAAVQILPDASKELEPLAWILTLPKFQVCVGTCFELSPA